MALTVALTGDWMQSMGNKRAVQGTITFDSSYLTGGEALVPSDIGLGVIDTIQFNPARHEADDTAMLIARYDYTNETVLLFEAEAVDLPFAEIGSGDDVALTTVNFWAVGQ